MSLYEKMVLESVPETLDDLVTLIPNYVRDYTSYMKGEEIFSGRNSTFFLATDLSTQENVSMKIFDLYILKDYDLKAYIREIYILFKVSNKFSVPLIGFTVKYPFAIITKYYPKGKLTKFIRGMSIKNQSKLTGTNMSIIAMCVSAALVYFEKMNIIHRDIKPGNILMDDNMIPKIFSFETARFFCPDSKMTKKIGTIYYMAPEVITSKNYDNNADVYSFGLLLYEMCEGRIPHAKYRREQIEQLVPDKSLDLIFKHTPKDIKRLILKCTDFVAENRPNAEEIYKLISSGKVVFPGTKKKSLKKIHELLHCQSKQVQPNENEVPNEVQSLFQNRKSATYINSTDCFDINYNNNNNIENNNNKCNNTNNCTDNNNDNNKNNSNINNNNNNSNNDNNNNDNNNNDNNNNNNINNNNIKNNNIKNNNNNNNNINNNNNNNNNINNNNNNNNNINNNNINNNNINNNNINNNNINNSNINNNNINNNNINNNNINNNSNDYNDNNDNYNNCYNENNDNYSNDNNDNDNKNCNDNNNNNNNNNKDNNNNNNDNNKINYNENKCHVLNYFKADGDNTNYFNGDNMINMIDYVNGNDVEESNIYNNNIEIINNFKLDKDFYNCNNENGSDNCLKLKCCRSDSSHSSDAEININNKNDGFIHFDVDVPYNFNSNKEISVSPYMYKNRSPMNDIDVFDTGLHLKWIASPNRRNFMVALKEFDAKLLPEYYPEFSKHAVTAMDKGVQEPDLVLMYGFIIRRIKKDPVIISYLYEESFFHKIDLSTPNLCKCGIDLFGYLFLTKRNLVDVSLNEKIIALLIYDPDSMVIQFGQYLSQLPPSKDSFPVIKIFTDESTIFINSSSASNYISLLYCLISTNNEYRTKEFKTVFEIFMNSLINTCDNKLSTTAILAVSHSLTANPDFASNIKNFYEILIKLINSPKPNDNLKHLLCRIDNYPKMKEIAPTMLKFAKRSKRCFYALMNYCNSSESNMKYVALLLDSWNSCGLPTAKNTFRLFLLLISKNKPKEKIINSISYPTLLSFIINNCNYKDHIIYNCLPSILRRSNLDQSFIQALTYNGFWKSFFKIGAACQNDDVLSSALLMADTISTILFVQEIYIILLKAHEILAKNPNIAHQTITFLVRMSFIPEARRYLEVYRHYFQRLINYPNYAQYASSFLVNLSKT